MLIHSLYTNRLLHPLVLGVTANIIINYFFNPNNPDFLWSEFLVAILLAVPLTELNFLLDKKLEEKFSWIFAFKKRLLIHLALLLLITVFIINILGNTYVFLIGDSFYSLKETLVINSVSFIIAIFLTCFSWLSFYYQQWKKAALALQNMTEKVNQSYKLINITRGKKQFVIQAEAIRQAIIKEGIVRVKTKENIFGVFNGTLSELNAHLPDYYFFLANRNTIIHRESIYSITSSTFGKIKVEINYGENEYMSITISRQKAANFRKWFYSNSTQYS